MHKYFSCTNRRVISLINCVQCTVVIIDFKKYKQPNFNLAKTAGPRARELHAFLAICDIQNIVDFR